MKEFKITFLDENRDIVKGIFNSESVDKIKSHFDKKGFSIIIISEVLKC